MDTRQWVIDDPTIEHLSPGWYHLLLGDMIDPPRWEVGRVRADMHFEPKGREWLEAKICQSGPLLYLASTPYSKLRGVVAIAPILAPKHLLEAHRVEAFHAALRKLAGSK
jgi:hypothetical protein